MRALAEKRDYEFKRQEGPKERCADSLTEKLNKYIRELETTNEHLAWALNESLKLLKYVPPSITETEDWKPLTGELYRIASIANALTTPSPPAQGVIR